MTPVSLADFKKLELKVAKILSAEEIPGADRIWKLEVDNGSEKKQVVAGIKAHYPKETLIGRSVIIIDNLEPAVIRGVESRGMLLAAKDANSLVLVGLDKELPPGSPVA